MDQAQKDKMAAGRKRYQEDQAAKKALAATEHPTVVAKVDEKPIGDVVITEPSANGHATLLDIRDPSKWQMKIRVHLESLTAEEAEQWMDGLRLIHEMAGTVCRLAVFRHVTARCFICNKPFTDGKPAGEAGYFDADRTYIKVYCCHNAEYPRLLEKCQQKEAAVAAWVERSEKAAQQAASDMRSAARKQMPA